MIQKKFFVFGFLGMALFSIIFIGLSTISHSLFFEFGTQNATTFRIQDTTGNIVASDRSDTSSLGFSGDDLIISLTGASPVTIYASEDSGTSNLSNQAKNTNLNSLSFLFSEKGGNFLYGSYIKFINLTELSDYNLSSVSIESATIFLSGNPGLSPSLMNISIYHVYSNVSWSETNITYNNQPCGANPILTNESACNLTSANMSIFSTGIWNEIDVTNIFRNTIARNYTNFSVFILSNTTGSAYFNRRETAGSSPYLIIRLATTSAAFKIKQTNGTETCTFYYNGNFSCTGISSFSSVSGVVPDLGGHDLYGGYRFINASRNPLKFQNITRSFSDGTDQIDTQGMFKGNYSTLPSFKMNIMGTTHQKSFTRFMQSGTLCNCADASSFCGAGGCSVANSPTNESISITFTQCADPDSPLNISEGEYINISFDPNNGVPQKLKIYFPRLDNYTACASGFALYVADDGSTYYDAGLTRLAYTTRFVLLNGTSMTSGSEFIYPEHVADIDDEDVESDLNTYVDIAGDTMTGKLTTTNVTVINFTGSGNAYVCADSNGNLFRKDSACV